jgi:hypothetical protein
MEISDQFHAQAAFILGRKPQYPPTWRQGESQSLSGSCEEEKNLLPLPGIKP